MALHARANSILQRLWTSSALLTWVGLIVRTAGAILLTPLILWKLDSAEIAIWYLFLTLLGLQVVVEFGFSQTFIRAVAYGRGGASELHRVQTPRVGADADTDSLAFLRQIRAAMQVSFRRQAALLFGVVGVIGSLALIRPIGHVADPLDAWAGWWILLGGTSFTLSRQQFACFLQGAERIAEFRRREILGTAIGIGGATLVLLFVPKLSLLAAATQSGLVATTFAMSLRCRQVAPEIFVHGVNVRPPSALLRVAWQTAWRSGVGVTMSQGLFAGTLIVYAQSGRPEVIASVLLAYRLLQTLSAASSAPFYTKLPALARLQAQGRVTEQIVLARRGMALSYWVYVAGTLCVALFVPVVLDVVGSSVRFVSLDLWFLASVAFLVERYGAMHLQLYSTTNDIVWHRANGIAGVIYVVVLSSLFGSLREYAFPAAVLAAYLGFYSWFAAVHSYRSFQLRFWDFESRTSLGPAVLLVALTLFSLLPSIERLTAPSL